MVILELNDGMKEKIIQLKELNSLWLSSVQKSVVGVTEEQGEINFDSQEFRNYYGDHSLSHNFWVNLVVDLDYNTINYLDDHRFYNIEEVLIVKLAKQLNEQGVGKLFCSVYS